MTHEELLTLEALVTRIHPTKEPGFDFEHEGKPAYSYGCDDAAAFLRVAAGSRVAITGRWSPECPGVFLCQRLRLLEDE